jgi:imidazolonepropionase-like amidohydrolase
LTLFFALAVLSGAASSIAQSVEDRRSWDSSNTNQSDDPRRIPLPPMQARPDSRLVLTGGRVLLGESLTPQVRDVVIEGNRIVRVEPSGVQVWPDGTRVIDVSGKTVMAGLIDLHVHLTFPFTTDAGPAIPGSWDSEAALRGAANLRSLALAGITSVRDMGGIGTAPFVLKRWIRAGRIPGPRVFPAGQIIAARGGHTAEGYDSRSTRFGGMRIASGADEWREAVREQFDRGADLIKLTSHFSPEEVQAAVYEAHRLGLKVSVHADPYFVRTAVDAGADVIEHAFPRTKETLERMATVGTAAVPTLAAFEFIERTRGGIFGAASARFLFSPAIAEETVRQMRRARVRIGVGTDALGDMFGDIQGLYVRELELLMTAGLSRREVLVAATRRSAELLGMSDRLGAIEPGKLADLIVCNGDPLEDLGALRRLDLVMADGRILIRDGRLEQP